MTTYARLTSAEGSSTGVVLLNGAESTGIKLLSTGWRDAAFGVPTVDVAWVTSADGPATKAGEVQQPRVFEMRLKVEAATSAARKAIAAPLLREIASVNQHGGRLRWRGPSASYAVEYVVRHIDLEQAWSHEAEAVHDQLIVASFSVDQYAEMDCMDVFDQFTTNTLGTAGRYNDEGADWTFITGSTDTAIDTTLGCIAASGTLTTERLLTHTGTPYTNAEVMVRARVRLGSIANTVKAGVVIKYVDASNYLEAYIDDTGAATRLRIDSVVATVRSNVVSTNLGTRATVNDEYDLRASIWGGTVYAEVFKNTATSAYRWAFGSADTAVTATVLSGSALTTLGPGIKGRQGVVFLPVATGTQVRAFASFPYTFRHSGGVNMANPFVFRAHGAIPGDAPAKCDVLIGTWSSVASGHAFAAWNSRASNFNIADSFSTTGWNTTALANVVTNAATSVAMAAANGAGYTTPLALHVITPALTDSGIHSYISHGFMGGKSYTAKCRVKSAAHTTGVRIKLGTDTGVAGELDTGSTVALTTSWQEITVDWDVPVGGRSMAVVAITTAAATATTFQISDLQVYETALGAPGAGALQMRRPPLAIVRAGLAAAEAPSSALANVTTGVSGSLMARRASFTNYTWAYVASGALADTITDPTAVFKIHPGALRRSPGSPVPVQIWAWYATESTRTSVVAKCAAYTVESGATVYPVEFGSSGVTLTGPSSGAFPVKRHAFLGTLMLPVPEDEDAYYTVAIALTSSGGAAFALDEILVAQADQMISTVYGDDPANITTTAAYTRRFGSDGAGAISQYTPGRGSTFVNDVGAVGAPILLAPNAEVDWAFWAGTVVPNAPTAASTTETNADGIDTTCHVAVTPRVVVGDE